MKNLDNSILEKIFANSFYPVYVPNVFYWNSVKKAEAITEAGKKALSLFYECPENEVRPGYVSKKELLEWAEGEIAKLDQYDRYESGLISGLEKLIEHLKVGK